MKIKAYRLLLPVLSLLLFLPGCMNVAGNQNVVSNITSGKTFRNERIAILPIKAQTSLAPDSVLALRAELNKRLGPAIQDKLPSSSIIDVPAVSDKLNQTNTLTVFEQLLSTYENTGVMDRRHIANLGNALNCSYLLLSRMKAEKMDLAFIGTGVGASLEVMLIHAGTGEIEWAGSGEWKRGGVFGSGRTTPNMMAEKITSLAFKSLQARESSAPPSAADTPAAAGVRETALQPDLAAGESHEQLVSRAQRQLVALGYQPGPIDGKIGKGTVKALKEFQQDSNLPETGQVDEQTLATLKQRISR